MREAEPLNDLIYHTPVDQSLTSHDLSAVFSKLDLPGTATRWATQIIEPQLRTILQWFNKTNPGRKTHADLSAIVFRCQYCYTVLWSSAVYLHRCQSPSLSEHPPPVWKYSKYHNPFSASWIISHGLQPWNADSVAIHAKATEWVMRIMEAVGVPTLEALASLNPPLQCQMCKPALPVQRRGFLRWTEAVRFPWQFVLFAH